MKNYNKLTNENKGFIFGFVGILIFSLTPPATKIALGPDNNALTPEFITFGRSALAGIMSLIYLFFFKKKKPTVKYIFNILIVALSLSVGFPLFLSLGLIHSTSTHAAVILTLMPLMTAVFASFYFKQKASLGFWICAIIGCIVVIIYTLIHGKSNNQIIEFSYSDILFFISVIAGATGYVFGAKLTKIMGSVDVISWALALAMPFHLALAVYYFPIKEIPTISWIGFLYAALFSQWIGFFAWYKALDLGGAVRVSQIQLFMPFLTFFFSIILLGETLDFFTIFFSIITILLIYLSRKMSVRNI
ncbi:MAG: DMT family transporter [Proteobacteria bacterium]|nr:DMT family transporter [Candidatus Fonsibacter lacus]